MDREDFIGLLSPDLKPILENAEKLSDEGLHQRAVKLFQRLEEYLPGNEYLAERIRQELAGAEARDSGPVAAGTGFSVVEERQDLDASVKELMKDLGISFDVAAHGGEEIPELSSLAKTMTGSQQLKAALDISAFAGCSGNWRTALQVIDNAHKEGQETARSLLWRLCCLVRLEEYADAVALFGSRNWEKNLLVHANYLSALAYEGLGISKQAKMRFQAVYNQDPDYRDVQQRLLNF